MQNTSLMAKFFQTKKLLLAREYKPSQLIKGIFCKANYSSLIITLYAFTTISSCFTQIYFSWTDIQPCEITQNKWGITLKVTFSQTPFRNLQSKIQEFSKPFKNPKLEIFIFLEVQKHFELPSGTEHRKAF